MKKPPKPPPPAKSIGQMFCDGLNRGVRADYERRQAKKKIWATLNATVFPPGTRFFYCDFMASACIPKVGFVVYDPEPRSLPAEVAIRHEPSILTEAQFRRLSKQYDSKEEAA